MIKKLGHQAPIGFRDRNFNSIELDGDFAYCKSHNFIYQPEIEQEKLYNGLPCYYTDIRFKDTLYNFFHNCSIYWTRRKPISLNACIRKTLRCRNIPVGTIVKFGKSWYFANRKFSNSFIFKIKKENKLDIEFEINNPIYSSQFTSCPFSKALTDELRANGFLVSVTTNTSFLSKMINTAIAHTRNTGFINEEITGETAIAYGHGKKIGFSSYNDNFMGYSNGCDNILWDKYGEFDKWSRCNEIPKSTTIEDIIKELVTIK